MYNPKIKTYKQTFYKQLWLIYISAFNLEDNINLLRLSAKVILIVKIRREVTTLNLLNRTQLRSHFNCH